MIQRAQLLSDIIKGLRHYPVVALSGPRQCGKTTLARQVMVENRGVYFDLENPAHTARLRNPQMVLSALKGLVVLDEIQLRPDLMPLLRVLADRRPIPCRFLILGSASPEMVRHSSESLAGRVHFVDMGGFTAEEVGVERFKRLWWRGGFPHSYLAKNDDVSQTWRENFIRTFLERDLPQLGVTVPSLVLRRFWTMIAHYHGQRWNGSEIAGSLGVTHPTTRRYLDVLTGAFVVRQLVPWYENAGKRVVKSPKVYVRDSGLLHTLLGLEKWEELESHPKYGFSWEGFALEQVLRRWGDRNVFFWATHAGAELDLLLMKGGKRWGFEFKCADAPVMTKSMHVALNDLKLERLWVVYPGSASYPLHEKAECIGLKDLGRIKI
jgi:uncharacterized protein